MDDLVARQKSKLSSTEEEKRREIVRQADAQNRIEGIFRGVETKEIVDAFVRGEIEVTGMFDRYKALSPRT